MLSFSTCSKKANNIEVALATNNWSDVLKDLKKNKILIKNYKGFNGESILHVVCSKGYHDNHIESIIDFLIKNGADLNDQDANGKTPLHCAAFYGLNPRTYSQLLSYGADESIIDKDGKSPQDYKKGKKGMN